MSSLKKPTLSSCQYEANARRVLTDLDMFDLVQMLAVLRSDSAGIYHPHMSLSIPEAFH